MYRNNIKIFNNTLVMEDRHMEEMSLRSTGVCFSVCVSRTPGFCRLMSIPGLF